MFLKYIDTWETVKERALFVNIEKHFMISNMKRKKTLRLKERKRLREKEKKRRRESFPCSKMFTYKESQTIEATVMFARE